MSYSAIGKAIKTVVDQTGVDHTVTTRILRRSRITALVEEDPDPAWRQKVAQQSARSLDTARRYYDFSDNKEPGHEVVERLQALRRSEGTNTKREEPAADEPIPGLSHRLTQAEKMMAEGLVVEELPDTSSTE